jgi:hypothetical protein
VTDVNKPPGYKFSGYRFLKLSYEIVSPPVLTMPIIINLQAAWLCLSKQAS